MPIYQIKEVLNYGGFFGGDTISAICILYGGDEEIDVTIDEQAFDNLKDRYKLLKGFVLDLEMEDEKVTRARILAAPERKQLKEAINRTTPVERKQRYRVFAYKCPNESLWIRGEPEELGEGQYRCVLCGTEFVS